MSATHTPGPWIVGNHPGDGSGSGWRQVVTEGLEFSPSYVCSALACDAYLIAAAPDMLAALELLADAGADNALFLHALSRARKAIAKATGAAA